MAKYTNYDERTYEEKIDRLTLTSAERKRIMNFLKKHGEYQFLKTHYKKSA